MIPWLRHTRVQIVLATLVPSWLLFTGVLVAGRLWLRSRVIDSYGVQAGPYFEEAFPWSMAAVGAAAGALIASALIYLFISRYVRVMAGLRALAVDLTQGNYTVRAEPPPPYLSWQTSRFVQSMNQLAEALESVERTRRDMFTNLAHEVRTPLTNLQGYLEGMRDGVIEPNAQALGTVHEEAVRLTRLVDTLQQLAHAEALKSRPLELRHIVVDDLVAQIADFKGQQMTERNLRFSLELGAPQVGLCVHADSITQVVRTVLTNALQYTEPGGWVRLSTSVSEGMYRIQCVNGRTHFPETQLPHIFNRFFRGENADRTGAGLGLPIAYELVTAHGGAIAATSGSGQFAIEVSLPLKRRAA